jgi:hypothetical protein
LSTLKPFFSMQSCLTVVPECSTCRFSLSSKVKGYNDN